ncbi:MAG TPA: response regulator [Verrucomicrobiae bacterium]|nr:response regulator [Verrucomicrobiae bacterium]
MENIFTPPVLGSEVLPEPSKKSRPFRILHADDDEDIRCYLKDILTQAGYAVDTARDGAGAWDDLRRNSYDLLITDNDMPEISGVGLIAKLRNAQMKLPVIMVTTAAPDQEFAKRPWLMPDAVVLKSVMSEQLLGKVKAVLCSRENLQPVNV